jgi:hypothetical protein
VGGIGGSIAGSYIKDADFTGNIAINPAFAGTGLTHIGGLAGDYSGTSLMEDCSAEGNLDIRSAASPGTSAQMLIGGIVGYISGTSSTARAVIRRSSYNRGNIAFTYTGTSHGQIYVGGAIGGAYSYGDIESCWSAAGSVNYTSTQNANTGQTGVGGFVGGQFSTAIAGCYAAAQVNVTAYNAVAGGFCGYLRTSSVAATLSRCYATGAVNAELTTARVGGLVGWASGVSDAHTKISDCYATGNVQASVNGLAGGLAGLCEFTDLESCFAAGTVMAQSSGPSDVYSGGVVGRLSSSSSLTNCAAVGAGNNPAVTAKGTGTLNIGRIVGEGVTLMIAPNYAYVGLRLGTTAGYYAEPTYKVVTSAASLPVPNPSGFVLDSDVGEPGNDGTDKTRAEFRAVATWTALGFSAVSWDFSNTASRGYPQLAWE